MALSLFREGKITIWVENIGSGRLFPITNIPAEHPSWSPDGRRIVFHSIDPETFTSTIFIVRDDGSRLREVRKGGVNPAWSPVGNKIALSFQNNIWIVNTDGSNPTFLTLEGYNDFPSWSPDGKKIVYCADGELAMVDIKSGIIEEILKDRYWKGYPTFSPDGSKVAFVSNRGGRYDIWIVGVDGKGLERVTDDPEREFYPQWLKEKEIYYLREEGKIRNVWKVVLEEVKPSPKKKRKAPQKEARRIRGF